MIRSLSNLPVLGLVGGSNDVSLAGCVRYVLFQEVLVIYWAKLKNREINVALK